jgi:acetyl esterase/lipase
VQGLTTTMPTVPSKISNFRFLVDMALHHAMIRIACVERFFVQEDVLQCHSTDGTRIALHRFTPSLYNVHANPCQQPLPSTPDKPAILYIHGGGYVAGSVPLFRREIMRYAFHTQTTVFAVAYRLAPEHPFPAALQDVLGALRHLHQNAAELAINPQRIGVLGIHAGGGLAVAAAMVVRNWGRGDVISRMVLVAPVLDDNYKSARLPGLSRMLTWTADVNAAAWRAYRGKAAEQHENFKELAMPGRAEDVTGLPLMYIDCGQLDRSVRACMHFVERVKASGGNALFRIYGGMPHAWDWEAPELGLARRAMRLRVDVLKLL